MTRRLFLVTLNCAAYAKSWDSPAFPSWTPEFIDKLLTDSPWAQQSDVRVELDTIQRMLEPTTTPTSFSQLEIPPGIGLPRTGSRIPGVGWPTGGGRGSGGGSAPGTGGTRLPPATTKTTAEIYLTTRWASALPIRRAQALQQYGPARLQTPDALDLLNTQPTNYILQIAGFPTTVIGQSSAKFAEVLKKSARLTIPGRKPMSPTDAEMPAPGMHLMATLTFPRLENLTPAEGHIELTAVTRAFKLHHRFKLKDMIYNGALEL